MGLFQNSVLRNQSQDEARIAARWAGFQKFLSKIDFIRGVKEEKYQDGFLKDIFESCLGYTLDSTDPSDFNLEREKKNETDGKKADGVIITNGEVIGVIELKDQKSKNLDAIEAQAFGYHASHAHSRYIIISNFDELRFYIDKKSYYEKFNLFSLDFDAFRKLHLLLSYESISSGLTNRLLEQSNRFEVDISKQLYRDFSAFRTHLFENMVKNNADIDKQTLLRLTQKLCDRLVFILFAEDRGLLRANTIKEIRQEFANQKFTNYALYDIYKFYFDAISCGNERLDIPQYNGGLFAKDALLDALSIDDEQIDLKAQRLSDYDFMSDIGVNILGHIFEQSLTDLEELNASINDTEFDRKKSKRKKDGVFYTPEYITRYIVENTLGKLCSDKKAELDIADIEPPKDSRKPTKKEQITKDHLEAYRNWLSNLKILDPACGSGAFLNQALEFLIREHKSLQQNLVIMGDITAIYAIEEGILEHNLYGVDINEDAVEIAKLSLWLRTAEKGRALTNLSDKIVCANSLLNMPFEENSFDVVIGNPPYIALSKLRETEYAKAGFEVFEKTGDILALFIEQGVKMTATDGIFSFIVSNSWLRTKYGEPLKRFLERMGSAQVINFENTQIFADATVESCIVSLTKDPTHTAPMRIIPLLNYTSEQSIEDAILHSADDNGTQALMTKIEAIGKPLKSWDISIYRGVLTGFNGAFIIDTATKEALIAHDPKSAEIIKPILRGRDVQKYETNWAGQWMIATFPSLKISIEKYPAVKAYLESFGARLDQSGEAGSRKKTKNAWFETQDQISYWQDFEKPKIVWGEISDAPKFAYDESGIYGNDKIFIMTGKKLKYLLAILNSKLSEWYFSHISVTTGQGTILWKKYKLELLPVAVAEDETPFVALVDEILEAKEKIKKYKKHFDTLSAVDKIEILQELEKLENRVSECENTIDSMVYKLYGLTSDEIRVVEGG